jgi:hypothetical protein
MLMQEAKLYALSDSRIASQLKDVIHQSKTIARRLNIPTTVNYVLEPLCLLCWYHNVAAPGTTVPGMNSSAMTTPVTSSSVMRSPGLMDLDIVYIFYSPKNGSSNNIKRKK